MGVRGMGQLKTNIAKLKQKIDDAARESEKEAAENLRDDMKARAPVDTGDLRDGIEAEETANGYRVGPSENDRDKALAQEYGTRYQDGQPFVVPAEEAARREFPETVAKKVKRRIK